jgi:AmiR/NasT family two-component response regulator
MASLDGGFSVNLDGSDPSTEVELKLDSETALDSRIVIEQAKGVLAARDSITPDEAFILRLRASRRILLKLHELAAGIVESVSRSADKTLD